MNVLTARSGLITLNNGVQMPALGLGMFLTHPEEAAVAVDAAIHTGYRLIDTGVSRNAAAASPTARNPLERPLIVDLGTKYSKTPAQIVLRWHIEHGLSAIPKSVRPERIAENIAIFGFSLNTDEVAAIDALDTRIRAGAREHVRSEAAESVPWHS